MRANGCLERLITNIPSPNGVTVSTTEKHVYVGVTRSQQVWRLPVMHDLAFSKRGVAIQLSGGVGTIISPTSPSAGPIAKRSISPTAVG